MGTIQGSDPVQSQSPCPSKHCEPCAGRRYCCCGSRKRCLLSPGRTWLCLLPPSAQPPSQAQPGQPAAGGSRAWGGNSQDHLPHIPCKAAPVLRWPGHLSPDWARGLPGGLGNRARHRAGTLGVGPCFAIRMLHSLSTATGMHVLLSPSDRHGVQSSENKSHCSLTWRLLISF